MHSVMNHNFGNVPVSNIKKSSFDRSHGYKTTFNEGNLIPFYLDEVLPGDEFKVNATLFARLSTLVTPPMDNIFLDTQFFFIPSRLVWNNFTKMMGERVNPSDSIDYIVPTINSGASGFAEGSLADYFGIPTKVPNLDVSVLPFRCYAKVWDDWYRAAEIQNSVIQSSDDLGDDASRIAWNTLLPRGKRADYFTSCLPSPQLGQAVNLPLGMSAPVVPESAFGDPAAIWMGSGSGPKVGNLQVNSDGTLKLSGSGYVAGNVEYRGPSDDGRPHTGLAVDLSNATAATINSLRTAFQLQRMLELDSRAGANRYITIILAHFGTVSPDGRLQRSEYLGGGSAPVNVHTVANTTGTATAPAGDLTAFATCSSNTGFRKAFTEHGYVIGLCSIRADINYQQGLNRLWSRRSRYEFYWPALAHLGEQPVYNKEIYAQGGDVHVDPEDPDSSLVDDGVFGYQERYAEYRYHPSVVTGLMRSNAQASLDVWHLAPYFTSLPKLNDDFIKDCPPIERIVAVPSEPHVILDSYISCKCTRPMPIYAVPGLIDHIA